MCRMFAGVLLLLAVSCEANAQGADCPTEAASGPTLSLSLDLAGRRGVPAGTTGQAYVAVPMNSPGLACRDARPPPSDILGGEPGDTLGPQVHDLLRGPGVPHVQVEVR